MEGILKWWESLHTFWQAVVTLSATALLGLIVFFLKRLIQYIVSSRRRKKEKESQKLHTHFLEMKSELTNLVGVLSKLLEYHGYLVPSSNYSEYEPGILPAPSKEFSSHFPEEASKVNEYKIHIDKHNKKRLELNAKIKQDFESRNFSVVDVNKPSKRPFYIYDTIDIPLFHWWPESNKPKPDRWIDFNKIESKAGGGKDNLYVKGWESQAIAYAKTDHGKKKCKTAIRKVANSEEYKGEVSYLILSADIILTAMQRLAQQISDKMNNIENFWPGTKSCKFTKKTRSCPRCKEIFS
jgi:hypothetical protein